MLRAALHGALSSAGIAPMAPSYGTVGWFARDAATLCAVGDRLLPPAAPDIVSRSNSARSGRGAHRRHQAPSCPLKTEKNEPGDPPRSAGRRHDA